MTIHAARVSASPATPAPAPASLPKWARRQLAVLAAVTQRLDAAGVPFWLWGGWAVDFRAGRVTRRHGDIDIVICESDRPALEHALADLGFQASPLEGHRFQLRTAPGPARKRRAPRWLRAVRGVAPRPVLLLYDRWRHAGDRGVQIGCSLVHGTPHNVRTVGPQGEAWPTGGLAPERVTFAGISCRVVSAQAIKHFKLQPHLLKGTGIRTKRAGGVRDRSDLRVLEQIILAGASPPGAPKYAAGRGSV